jgi:cell division protein FtsL
MKTGWLDLCAVVALAAGVTASGVWIVRAEHDSRQLFIQAEALSRERDQLQVDWRRLQIEQSTYATYPRIEAIARDRLHLTVPQDDELVVVETPAGKR